MDNLPSRCGKKEPRLPQNLRGLSRGRVPTDDGINVMTTRRGIRVAVPEHFRRKTGRRET